MKTETNEQSHARWEREKEADQAAIQLGLAYREARHGVCYWDKHASEAFRAGFEAGKNAQLAAAQQGVQPTLIARLESIALKFAAAYEDAGRETYREDVEKQARKAKQELTAALQSALATHPTPQGLDAAPARVPNSTLTLIKQALESAVSRIAETPKHPNLIGTIEWNALQEVNAAIAAQVKQGGVANG